ncbi:MAG: cyclic nucleotide-binding domain-containing protein [Gammaproteobacteria bacterium]|nr:cyclic nucleotide-binding domain-containing protein [Gammaproteobacteria bacterium]
MSAQPDIEIIGTSTLGNELSLKECEVVASIMEVRHLNDGECLINESGHEHTLFLLADGKLDVINSKQNSNNTVYSMTPGEVAGTRAFVERTPRRASLRSAGTTTIYTLEPTPFEELLKTRPDIVYKVMRALFRITHENLRRMNRETAQLTNYINKSNGRY